jgi:WD40 repeat protein
MMIDLASSWSGSRIARAAGNDDRHVQVWDLDGRRPVANFVTVRQAGGSRLAISPDGGLVSAAAYVGGVGVYEVDTGRPRWRRLDIAAVQETMFSKDGGQVFYLSDRGPARMLDAIDGKTIRELPRVCWLCQSPVNSHCVVFDGTRYAYLDQPTVVMSPVAVRGQPIAAAFSDKALCLAEIRGPIRFFDVGTNTEVARVTAPTDCHWIRVAYNAAADEFFAILYDFERARAVLQSFDGKSGAMEDVCVLDSSTYIFCRRGGHILGPAGDERETATGKLLQHFHWDAS